MVEVIVRQLIIHGEMIDATFVPRSPSAQSHYYFLYP